MNANRDMDNQPSEAAETIQNKNATVLFEFTGKSVRMVLIERSWVEIKQQVSSPTIRASCVEICRRAVFRGKAL